MREELDRKEFHEAIDTTLSGLQGDPWLAQRIISVERMEKPKMRKKLSFGIILAIALSLVVVTAVAVTLALLSPKEVVEEIAVPLAKQNDPIQGRKQAYSYDEMVGIIQSLNENGITLDENSTIMQAFRAGHGYWEADTIEAIYKASFGEDISDWTLDEMHWYGEAMLQIGAWPSNPYLVPEEGDMTFEEASSFAASAVKATFGADVPVQSDANWRINVWFERPFDYENSWYSEEGGQWRFEYYRSRHSGLIYAITFDRTGEWTEPYAWPWKENLELAGNVRTLINVLEARDGPRPEWNAEDWAAFEQEIFRFADDISTTHEWLYQNADYCEVPENAISQSDAIEIAVRESSVENADIKQAFYCTGGSNIIWKVNLFCDVIWDLNDYHFNAQEVWSVEVDAASGKILSKQRFAKTDGTEIHLYVPSSLLDQVPDGLLDPEEDTRTDEEKALAEKEAAYEAQYGENSRFWPPEIVVELYGPPYTLPTQEEYDAVLAAAIRAIDAQDGPGSVERLGDYQVGLFFYKSTGEDGITTINFDLTITTDPEFLSDGWNVHCDFFSESDCETFWIQHATDTNG